MCLRTYLNRQGGSSQRPNRARAQEPEPLGDWPQEVALEERRRRNIAALRRMDERQFSERLAAMSCWRCWLARAARRERNGRADIR